MTTVSIISWWEFELFLFCTECCESLGRTKTIIRSPFLTHLMESWCIGINSFGLDIWAIFATMTNTLIWYKPKDIMCIENAIYSSLYKTSPISIFYADDILSLIMVRPEVTIKCSAE
jgi:hypothetical protein